MVGMETDAKFHIGRFEALKNARSNWESMWKQISELVNLNSSSFPEDSAGSKRTNKLYDSTGVYANDLLAAGIHGILTNPASRWMALKAVLPDGSEPSKVVKEFMQHATDVIYDELSSTSSTFPTTTHEYYLNLSSFCTSVMYVGEEIPNSGELIFKSIDLNNCVIAENFSGIVDTVYVKYSMTVKQIVDKWPDSKDIKSIANCLRSKELDKKHDVIHCVYPRKDVSSEKITSDNKPIASLHILADGKELLETSGYDSMPYIATRWMKTPGEIYGRGPGINSLPDILMLQEVKRTMIRAAQKAVDPTLQAEDSSVIGPVVSVPGGIVWRRPGSEPLKPLVSDIKYGLGMDVIASLKETIFNNFFIDQLQLQNGPQMTATEVMQRTEERLRLLGPILGRMQTEYLGPMLHRVFSIMLNAERFGPVPEELVGVSYKIEYVSPLARAQKQIEASSLMRVIELSAPFVQMDPTSSNVFNSERVIRWISNLYGVPEGLLRDSDEVANILAQQQQQQQLAAMSSMANQTADTVDKLGGVEEAEAVVSKIAGDQQ